jgi:hypothetical protein
MAGFIFRSNTQFEILRGNIDSNSHGLPARLLCPERSARRHSSSLTMVFKFLVDPFLIPVDQDLENDVTDTNLGGGIFTSACDA